MGKKTTYENYRVVIEPRGLGDFGRISVGDRLVSSGEEDRQRQYRERCHEISADVKRHVDNVGLAHVDFDTVLVCEYCGQSWTEESPEYNGGCCEKDESEQEARQRAIEKVST